MKQPEIFKNWRKSWENPICHYDLKSDEKYMNELREKAIIAIKTYKEERKKVEEHKRNREEVLEFFKELDKINKD